MAHWNKFMEKALSEKEKLDEAVNKKPEKKVVKSSSHWNKFMERSLSEEVSKTIIIPLSNNEKKIIGDIKIYKEKYKLDRTQSNYRYDKNTFSSTFEEKENLEMLKQLVKQVKGKK